MPCFNSFNINIPVLFRRHRARPCRRGRTLRTRQKYAYVDLGCNAYLCGEPNESAALFLIPQTYCVEILGEQKEWFRVRYAEDNGIYRAVEGFCLKADLIECDAPLENLYLHMPVKVIYKTEKPPASLPELGDIELTAAYYGAYRIGKTDCSYVLCNDKFAYIPEAVTDYPLNTLPERPTIAPQKRRNKRRAYRRDSGNRCRGSGNNRAVLHRQTPAQANAPAQ